MGPQATAVVERAPYWCLDEIFEKLSPVERTAVGSFSCEWGSEQEGCAEADSGESVPVIDGYEVADKVAG